MSHLPSPPPPFTHPDWTELCSGLNFPGLARGCLGTAERERRAARAAGAGSSARMLQRCYPGEPAELAPPAPPRGRGRGPARRQWPARAPATSRPRLASSAAGAPLYRKLSRSVHHVAPRHPSPLSSLAQILATVYERRGEGVFSGSHLAFSKPSSTQQAR